MVDRLSDRGPVVGWSRELYDMDNRSGTEGPLLTQI
jgi:hypothetical protein